jgi:excinuclease ABC subunit A
MPDFIAVRGARLHNLKNLDVDIPRSRLVVLTGLSGSGKSTLGFDILHHEAMRQYLDSLGLATFGVSKPPVDSISGLSPSISLDQRNNNRSPRSTVGTVTDLYTFVRLLYARLGRRPCPACGNVVPPLSGEEGAWDDDADDPDTQTFPCPHCGAPLTLFAMGHFSFNKPAGACPTCTGLGVVQRVNVDRLVDADRGLAEGAVLGWEKGYTAYFVENFTAAARHYGFDFDPQRPLRDYGPAERALLFYGAESADFRQHYPDVTPPATTRAGRIEGIATALLRRAAEHADDPEYRARLAGQLIEETCPGCHGTRLRPESRAVTIAGQTIVETAGLSLEALADWVRALPEALGPDEQTLAESILTALRDSLGRLLAVGAGYLTLDQAAPSLSAGEAQRLRLAALVGSGLTGVLYIFDEPTIGLHQRDTARLIGVMRRLRDLENTVLVIEHDMDVIRAADHVIDIGLGAGRDGGRVVAAGPPAVVARQATPTGDYLAGRLTAPPGRGRAPGERALVIRGARAHNLRDLTVRLPLGLLVAVTGVSGSGKTSLIFDTLDRAGRRRFYGATDPVGDHDAIDGWEHVDKLITIDQEPIGRLPRSNAATYADVFTPIRNLFAAQPEAQRRGFTPRHFSFNVPGGRCPRCEGTGVLTVHMQLLSDVEVRCPTCHGRRFDEATLAVTYGDKTIADVLEMTVAEALALFAGVPAAASRLGVLDDVGLGYLQLGQPTATLSGGEAQRVKLAKELGRRATGRALYLLDEPTIGLHAADTARLLGLLQRLVDAGHSVVVVEHNLDVIRAADWIIDMGPEGGAAGGQLVAEGPPEQVARVAGSHTGKWLKSGA